MLLSGEERGRPPAQTLLQQGIACLQTGQWAEGYALFCCAQKDRPQDVAVCYNLALCHVQAGQYAEAVARLDEGLSLLKAQKPARPFAFTEDAALAALQKCDAHSDAYKAPLYEWVPHTFYGATKLRFLRLLADACAGAGLWQRVARLAAALEPHGYANVAAALQAGQKQGTL